MNTEPPALVKQSAPATLSLDIGGTWTRAARVSSAGRILSSTRERTADQGSGAEFVDQCVRLLAPMVDGVDGPPTALGVSTTGPVDTDTGTLFVPPNTGPALHGLRLGDALRSRLHLPVTVEKDTNAAAIAEQRYGAARGLRTFLYLTVSTGIGATIIADDCAIRGADGAAGEVGHVSVDPAGPDCACGRRGCLEAIASGPAIANAGRRIAQRRPDSRLGQTARQLGHSALQGQHVADAAAAGDTAAAAIMDAARAALVSAVVDLVNVFNPEALVLGGSVIAGNPSWAREASRTVGELALPPARTRAQVRAAELGDKAGLLGAAWLAARLEATK